MIASPDRWAGLVVEDPTPGPDQASTRKPSGEPSADLARQAASGYGEAGEPSEQDLARVRRFLVDNGDEPVSESGGV